MKAAWITDVHLNLLVDSDTDRFLDSLSETNSDIVLLTGDIGEADTAGPFLSRMEQALACPIYFVLGNHDFYGGSISTVRSEMKSITRHSDHLIWMNQEGVVSLTASTALIGHDTWADGRLGSNATSSFELNDFY